MLLAVSVAATMAMALHASRDVWMYGEAGNYCMAFFRHSPTQLVIRFSALTDDDTIQVWRKGLPSLTKNMDPQESNAAAGRHYDLSVTIAGVEIPLTSQTGDLKPEKVPGIAYVIGVQDKAFIAALKQGGEVKVLRGTKVIANYRIGSSEALADRFSSCVSQR